MTRLKLTCVLSFIAAIGLLAAAPPQDTVSVLISNVNGRQPRLGLPDFLLTGADAELTAAARTVVDVLWRDLEFEQEFYMIPQEVARAVPLAPNAQAVPISAWAERGADYVLVAAPRRSGPSLDVDVHVIAVAGATPGKSVFSTRYGCQMAYLRACAHAMSDSLHKRLFNVDGVAMSRLAFASDRSGEKASNVLPRSSREIYISDYDGDGVSPVTNNRALNIAPAWSPDGKQIAYVSYQTGNAKIYIKSVYEARQAWTLGGPAGADNFGPAFSPNGSEIAFYSNRDGTHQIYLAPPDGKTPARRLTTNKTYEQNPTWSPNGGQIAFTSDRAGSGNPMLYIMNADGTGQNALSCGGRCDRPSWSPTGEFIAFTCGGVTPFNICTVNIRSNTLQKLLPDDGFSNEQPVFAPNGRHIAFKTNRWGKDEIAIMDWKGNIQRRITQVGNNSYPSWSKSK
jgi:TolB protein